MIMLVVFEKLEPDVCMYDVSINWYINLPLNNYSINLADTQPSPGCGLGGWVSVWVWCLPVGASCCVWLLSWVEAGWHACQWHWEVVCGRLAQIHACHMHCTPAAEALWSYAKMHSSGMYCLPLAHQWIPCLHWFLPDWPVAGECGRGDAGLLDAVISTYPC